MNKLLKRVNIRYRLLHKGSSTITVYGAISGEVHSWIPERVGMDLFSSHSPTLNSIHEGANSLIRAMHPRENEFL